MDIQLIKNDPYLKPYKNSISRRIKKAKLKEIELTQGGSLSDFSNAHHFFGLHIHETYQIYRDWLPYAKDVYLVGPFSNWESNKVFKLERKENGIFEIKLNSGTLKHGDLYRLFVYWNSGSGDRIPAYTKRVVQDEESKIFNAQVWNPTKPYKLKHKQPAKKDTIFIYEAHIGMASEEGKVGSFNEFRKNILPTIVKSGYDTIQLMAIQEHPYYGSFGYHVSNYFAVSSRFGTPEDLKKLIDEAHKNKIRVIMDIVHSHAVKNEVEGISKYDGSEFQFFHAGARGHHEAWDSKCFDYSKNEVLHFLLSNCKFWLEEYGFDGFRFDGITSMLYLNHGLATDFVSYDQYFDKNQDEDAVNYLILANKLIHEINPNAITIAEDMSGMPGIAFPIEGGGLGFDYRLAMGIPDYWIKIIKELKDEEWSVGDIFHRLTDKRQDELAINYSESHDQALVGDKTIIFRLADKDMYFNMEIDNMSIKVERAVALHKIILLFTAATSQGGYLNFMGNEFGHPEWIDFPREGNDWSYNFARRQWSLAKDKKLAYYYLNLFNDKTIHLLNKNKILKSKIELINSNEGDQVVVFKRKKFLFVFNFNPSQSFTDYGFEIDKGKYKIILNSDNKDFLGYDRIDEETQYQTLKINKKDYLKLYIPNRTCFVLKRV